MGTKIHLNKNPQIRMYILHLVKVISLLSKFLCIAILRKCMYFLHKSNFPTFEGCLEKKVVLVFAYLYFSSLREDGDTNQNSKSDSSPSFLNSSASIDFFLLIYKILQHFVLTKPKNFTMKSEDSIFRLSSARILKLLMIKMSHFIKIFTQNHCKYSFLII